MTRSERQELCIQKWIKAKCRGTLELATGFGKTKTALDAISKFLAKNPGRSILVSVPTEEIKQQWLKGLADRGLFMNVQVEIINSIVKHDRIVDMLVIDKIFCRCKIYWIAGNSLSSINYKIISNDKFECWKIIEIGQSAAKTPTIIGVKFTDYPEREYIWIY